MKGETGMQKVRKCEVVGYKPVEYTRKQTGEFVQGYEVHFIYEDDSIQGNGVGSVFVHRQDKASMELGEVVKIFHDDFQRRFTYIVE